MYSAKQKTRRRLVFPGPEKTFELIGKNPMPPITTPLSYSAIPLLTMAPHSAGVRGSDYEISKIISRETIPSYNGADIFVTDVTTLHHAIKRGNITKPITIINAAASHTPDPINPSSRGLPLNHEDPQLKLLTKLGESIFIQRLEHNQITHTVVNICLEDTPGAQLGPLLYAVTPRVKTEVVDRKRDTYFCCAAGRSRSVSLLMGFLARYSDLTKPHDALAFIQKYHASAQPNEGFIRQLRNFFIGILTDKEILIETKDVKLDYDRVALK